MSGVNPPGSGSQSGEFQAPPDEAVREAVDEPTEEASMAQPSANGDPFTASGAPESLLQIFGAVEQQLLA